MKPVICTECKERITDKKELTVAGKMMQPYHNLCLEKPGSNLGKLQKFTGKFPLGHKFWLFIAIGNIALGEVMRRNPESLFVLVLFTILFNTVFMGARIAIYYSYEQHLQ